VGKSRPTYTIAMSDNGMKADRERIVDAGFRHHLVKPVMPEKLSTLLEQAIVELRVEKWRG
jgi:CheY-like chemotaxis protein